ncbi:hypothetical protein N9W34_01025 [Rickettsiales bacterium]|nr:hypothetical protein [Rickettsiales bacterium]
MSKSGDVILKIKSSPLHYNIINRKYEEAKRIIKEEQEDLDKEISGFTPLHLLLVKASGDNQENGDKLKGTIEVIRTLVEKGADINRPLNFDSITLDDDEEEEKTLTQETPLDFAIRNNITDVIGILEKFGAKKFPATDNEKADSFKPTETFAENFTPGSRASSQGRVRS